MSQKYLKIPLVYKAGNVGLERPFLMPPMGFPAEPLVPVLLRVATQQRFAPVGDQDSQIAACRGKGHWTI